MTDLKEGVQELDLDQVLGPLLRQPGGLKGGSAYLLNLRPLKDHLGERWRVHADRIYSTIDATMNELITSPDVFARAGPDRYVVAFSQNNNANAAVRAALLARRIKDKIIGERADVSVGISLLEANHTAQQDDGLAGPSGAVADLSAPGQLPGIDYKFVPIWDAIHKVMSTYYCVPVQPARSGRLRFGHELVDSQASEVDRAEFDAETVKYLIDIADDLYRNKFAVLTSFSVDYRSLGTSKSREIVLRACAAVPSHLRRFMVVIIDNLPIDVPTTTLGERVGLLRPFFRSIIVQLSSLSGRFSRLDYLGLHAVNFPFYLWPADKPFDYDLLASAISQVKTLRMHFGLTGVPNLEMASRAVALGVTYLSGPFLGKALDMPANMVRCTLEDLGQGFKS